MAFWKKNEPADDAGEPTPAPPAPRKEPSMAMLRREENAATGEINAVLGRGSAFEGKLTFEGTVRIEGKFSGEIHTADTLVIGDGAKVEAEIYAGAVVVSGGEVTGNIRAKNTVELDRGAKIRGNIETPSLKIEKGVVFNGSCKMENLGEAKVTSLADKAEKK